ncbi:MAG: hypothetical protein ACR2MA_11020, partial [Egibacteraceae bacterium]
LNLLGTTWDWRTRLVETLTFRDAEHVRVRSTYQVELDETFLRRWSAQSADRVRVLLPLTTRAKANLLNFDLSGPNGEQVHLLKRRQIAALQTDHLVQLRDSSPVDPSRLAGLGPPLLYAISSFLPGAWRQFTAEHGSDAMLMYLRDGLRLPVQPDDVAGWLEQSARAGTLIRDALKEPESPDSSSECLTLALPLMDPMSSVGTVDAVLEGYLHAVEAASEGEDHELLQVLGEYGRRWEVVVEAELPVGQPALLTMLEDRPIDELPYVHRFALGDAASGHLEARTADHHVVVDDYAAHDLRGKKVGVPIIESARRTDEVLSLYSSAPDRPSYIDVTIELSPSSYIRWLGIGSLALTVTSWVAVLVARSDLLALAVLPVSFAVTFVLTRAETPLTARLQRSVRRRLGLAVAVLWLLVLFRLGADTPFSWLGRASAKKARKTPEGH